MLPQHIINIICLIPHKKKQNSNNQITQLLNNFVPPPFNPIFSFLLQHQSISQEDLHSQLDIMTMRRRHWCINGGASPTDSDLCNMNNDELFLSFLFQLLC